MRGTCISNSSLRSGALSYLQTTMVKTTHKLKCKDTYQHDSIFSALLTGPISM